MTRNDSKQAGRHGSLARNITIWMFLVGMGPLVIMAYQGYHCARQAVLESKEEHLLSILESRKAQIETWLTEVKSDFSFMAITPCTTGSCAGLACCSSPAGTAECCEFLESVRKRNPAYESIVAVDLDWNPVNRTRGASPEFPRRLPSAFKGTLAAAGVDTVISPAQREADGRLLCYAGRAFRGEQDAGGGYVVAVLNLTGALQTLLSDRSGLGETGRVYLISPDNRYLLSAEDNIDLKGAVGGRWFREIQRGGNAVRQYENYRGDQVFGAAGTIPSLGWLMLAEETQREAFAWLRILRTRALLTGAVTLILLLFLSIRGARILAQPLTELAVVTRKIAGGRHDERVGPLSGREAQSVGLAFNRMMDQLGESHRQLVNAASLAAVGQLSSSVVHEMRNPLSSVKLNLQALRRKVEGDEVHAELADIALEQAGRLEHMLSDLLGYGKPLELNVTRVDLSRLVGESMADVGQEAETRGVRVVVDEGSGGMEFTADSELMRRALSNLISNAVKAAPEGGEVRVSAGHSEEEENRVEIRVADNGDGIPDVVMPKLFRPFFSTRDGGTGLGLAYVKKVADAHGGSVRAVNRSEGGACFVIILPEGGTGE